MNVPFVRVLLQAPFAASKKSGLNLQPVFVCLEQAATPPTFNS